MIKEAEYFSASFIFANMKLAVKLLLFTFMLFLSTPTIVTMIEKSCDTSIFFGMSEEELVHKEIKEIKGHISFDDLDIFKISKLKSTVISQKNSLKHNSGYLTIFTPPPNC